jgi:hypothetical protein
VSGIKTCKACGVPIRVGKGHNWNFDGTITQRRDPDHFLAFIDSNGVNALFANIEQLIGVPIEKIIIESKARATRAYIGKMIRGTKGTLARIVGLERIVRRIVEQGRVLGLGDIKVHEFNWKEAYMYCEIGNPYSLPLFLGDLKGSTEAIRKFVGTVTYEQIGPDRYMVKNFQAPHAPELEDRLYPSPKPRKPGHVEFKRCTGCGAPVEISHFRWDLERGTITDPETGLRVALFGPIGLQAIFDELEEELGEAIPETIIEAQRLYVTTTTGSFWKSLREDNFGHWLALFGLGNLVSLEQEGMDVTVRIENPRLPLILAGTALGLYEIVSGTRGSAKWSIADDGDLTIAMAPQQ